CCAGLLRHRRAFPTRRSSDLAMLGTIQDVTEAIKARERLEKSEHKFRKLFENHSAIHMLLDPGTGRIMSANKAAAEFYGWSTERSEEHTSELQSRENLVCRLL